MQLIKSIYDSFHISFPTMKVAGYFKLMLLGTYMYTIIVFECRTHSSLKWPPLMIQINLLALDTVKSISIILRRERGSVLPVF